MRFLVNMTGLSGRSTGTVIGGVDDTIIEGHGHHEHGAGFGYFGVCGINALLVNGQPTDSTRSSPPVP